MTSEELVLLIDRATQERSTHLDLYQQKLKSIPSAIGNLSDLVSLRLTDNRLTSLPDAIGNLTKLRELRLYKNQINSLPDSIANLQNLTWLSLSLNRLTVFPDSITHLTNLEGLQLNGNQLRVLPDAIAQLRNLTYLDITGNPLIDLSVLKRMPNLRMVKFWNVNLPRKYWKHIDSIPSAFQFLNGQIHEIEIQELNNNFFDTSGRVQKLVIKSPSSPYIYLSTATMARSSPRTIDNCSEDILQYHIHLSNNKLTSLPFDIGKINRLNCLELRNNQLTSIPPSISNLHNLTHLDLRGNKLTFLPASIDNLTDLRHLYLSRNFLTSLPDGISEMSKLTHLYLNANNIDSLNLDFDRLTQLIELDLSRNQLTELPDNIGKLIGLEILNLSSNQLTELPQSIGSLHKLKTLNLSLNPLADLSILQKISELSVVIFFGINLPRRYWTKFSEWQPKWLLDEDNVEVRRTLIQQVGYERICQELDAIEIDSWREYTLLKIDAVREIFRGHPWFRGEPMVLLKMICPSTGHIHVLRVPPMTTSAEEAITWINHGIHPDKFTIQT